ncbi:hypothetical protein OC835_006937, partial [Tilletia horrida]
MASLFQSELSTQPSKDSSSGSKSDKSTSSSRSAKLFTMVKQRALGSGSDSSTKTSTTKTITSQMSHSSEDLLGSGKSIDAPTERPAVPELRTPPETRPSTSGSPSQGFVSPTSGSKLRSGHLVRPVSSAFDIDARNAYRMSMADVFGRSFTPHPPTGAKQPQATAAAAASNTLGHRALVSDMLHIIVGAAHGLRRIQLDGHHLSLGELVSISRFGAACSPHEGCRPEIERSRRILLDTVDTGDIVYGVNTMYGGNAAAPSTPGNVQNALTGLLYGIMPSELTLSVSAPFTLSADANYTNPPSLVGPASSTQFASTIAQSHALPVAWVRGAMVLRTNTFMRGNSAVRWEVIETLSQMIAEEVTPLVPSQGSISASGDLSPLAYIAYAMAGNPGVQVLKGRGPSVKLWSCSLALRSASITPLTFSAKEVLAITNGTSVSCSVAAHGLADAHVLMLLAQLVTAANAEAMMASQDSFDAFLSDECRPHPGQIEIAGNLRAFLSGSVLTHKGKSPRSPLARCLQLALELNDYEAAELGNIGEAFFLRQDRYPFRTAPQWLGPPVEDLMHAHRTLTIEMNSVNDNPIVEGSSSAGPRIMHGGNFQALAVTNATEKVRDAAAYVGRRILFAQQEELVNPALSCGLPANLTLAEPSEEGGFKGVSIGCAALASELGYLANRAGHFVQSAELHNQSLNSLALISARSTASSIETLTKLVCHTIVMACQALDVRTCFISHLRLLATELSDWLGLSDSIAPSSSVSVMNHIGTPTTKSELDLRPRRRALHKLMAVMALALMRHTSLDSVARATIAAKEGARAMLEVQMEEALQPRKEKRVKDKRSARAEVSVCSVLLSGAQLYLQAENVPHLDVPDAAAEETLSNERGDSDAGTRRRGRSLHTDASSMADRSRVSSDPFSIASAADFPEPEPEPVQQQPPKPDSAPAAELFFYVLEPALAHVVQRTFVRSRDAYFRASRQKPAKSESPSSSHEWNQPIATSARMKAPSRAVVSAHDAMAALPTSPIPYLGKGTAALYRMVRHQVGIRMHRNVGLDQPGVEPSANRADRQQWQRRRQRQSRRQEETEHGAGNGSGSGGRPTSRAGDDDINAGDDGIGNGCDSDEEEDEGPRRTLGEKMSVLYEALRNPVELLQGLDAIISVAE